MKDSIVVDMRYAEYDMIDGTPNVHRHHIFEGTANRRLSDEDGLWVPLSYEHHEGKMSVHMNKEMSTLMHIIGPVGMGETLRCRWRVGGECKRTVPKEIRAQLLIG